MASRSRVPFVVRRAVIVTAMAAMPGAVPADGSARVPAAAAQREQVNPQAAALQEFQKRLQAYLDLREALSKKIEPLSPTPSAAELSARQEALAVAMKTARAGAKQGDLVPKPVADQIAAIVAADRKRRRPAAKSAALQEVPGLPRPAINRTYPPDAALPTLPPLLLADLPMLPDNLQYRFYGRHLVIVDGDLQVIADYVSDVLAPPVR